MHPTLAEADGTKKDITRARVKEYVANDHPSAPEGTMQKVKFEDAQAGSKGYKRDPTDSKLSMIDKVEKE